ncbi:uncharacterized protein [Nicotiana sylvestris]|uniref:uncharacterized protein n=1 Tax=Nicotiana sylvestris TaxID=4096 RepID=UPI00388CA0D4
MTCNETTQQTNIDSEEDIPEEIVKEVENSENRPKSNLDETEIVNLGDAKLSRKHESAFTYHREGIAESYDGWRMYFDGEANFKGVCIGAVLVSETGQYYPVSAKLRFPCTNNMVEYEACILGLKMVIDMNIQELLVIGDSDLLIHQVREERATKNAKILHYLHHVHELRKRFTKTEFQYVPRFQNEFVDALATLSSMIRHPDKNFIDPIPFVRKCHGCQTHAYMIKVPPNELNATSSMWPFAAWGMDVIGPIKPAASNGHRFILVVIDYFTKWVEAASYKAVTKKFVADFVCDRIICRFGIPKSINTDNGSNLNSDLMKSICETFKIKHKNSTAYRPKMNGAVEATNKNIKKILRKMIEKHRQWHEKLSFALLGYYTTVRTSTEATPYMLVYGTEAVIPAEVEIPSLRIIQDAKLDDVEWVKNRYDQLALIYGKRMNAAFHGT